MAVIEPERCIAHMVSGPNKGQRCQKRGLYIPGNGWNHIKNTPIRVCLYHYRHRSWMWDMVQRFYLGRYWE